MTAAEGKRVEVEAFLLFHFLNSLSNSSPIEAWQLFLQLLFFAAASKKEERYSSSHFNTHSREITFEECCMLGRMAGSGYFGDDGGGAFSASTVF